MRQRTGHRSPSFVGGPQGGPAENDPCANVIDFPTESTLCTRRDLNPHTLRYRNLNRERSSRTSANRVE